MAVELGVHGIRYRPRTSIQRMADADFIAEFTGNQFNESRISETIIPTWRLYVDGSSYQQSSGAGLILVTPEHTEISSAFRFGFKTSNNEAEYEALLADLRLTKEMEAEKLEIFSDSQLIMNQVISEYQVNESMMLVYLQKVKKLLMNFGEYTITQVSMEENSKAYALARLALATDASLNGLILVEFLQNPSINHEENKEINLMNTIGSWTDLIISYLKDKKIT